MKDTYQGYSNRSTWLAALHLNNTNEYIYKEARRLAEAKDRSQLIGLLAETQVSKEQDYDIAEVDVNEVIEALED